MIDEQLRGGSPILFSSPLRGRQLIGFSHGAERLSSCGQQQGVGGDSQGGDVFNGKLVTDLCLAEAQQGFLITEIHLDIPSPEVGL